MTSPSPGRRNLQGANSTPNKLRRSSRLQSLSSNEDKTSEEDKSSGEDKSFVEEKSLDEEKSSEVEKLDQSNGITVLIDRTDNNLMVVESDNLYDDIPSKRLFKDMIQEEEVVEFDLSEPEQEDLDFIAPEEDDVEDIPKPSADMNEEKEEVTIETNELLEQCQSVEMQEEELANNEKAIVSSKVVSLFDGYL